MPVICKCGRTMVCVSESKREHDDKPYQARFRCLCGWWGPKRGGYTQEEANERAREAANPPNLPLTREQVEAMDELAAVWVAYEEDDVATNIIFAADALYTIRQGNRDKGLYFAAKPTPEDIEAARKEHTP